MYRLVHQIRGRLRLKIPCLAWDEDYAGRLEWLILKKTLITGYRINNSAASLIVFYDGETSPEAVILDYLETLIQQASQKIQSISFVPTKAADFGFPVLAMITAILATPLELPFLLVGGSILVASVPLWQRVGTAITQKGEIPIESLDVLWLTAQLIQGNGIAGALALNLAQAGESLRRTQLEPRQNSLYLLGEEYTNQEESLQIIEQEESPTQNQVLPTILLSSVTAILTNDWARASAWLPLNVRLSSSAINPALTTTTDRWGVYIRNSQTVNKNLAIAIAGNLLAVGGGVIFGLDPIITVLINGGSVILGELNTMPNKKSTV